MQTWKQHFCWTLDGLPAAMAERDAQLLRAQSTQQGGLQALLGQLSGGRRWLTAAAEKVGWLAGYVAGEISLHLHQEVQGREVMLLPGLCFRDEK